MTSLYLKATKLLFFNNLASFSSIILELPDSIGAFKKLYIFLNEECSQVSR